jgi:2,4-dienoyl-CoA reductase-like NADH-dependent reductase (Old Yellow Enzyme family)
MIEIIFRGHCASNVYQDNENTMADLVSYARKCVSDPDMPIYIRTPCMCIEVSSQGLRSSQVTLAGDVR